MSDLHGRELRSQLATYENYQLDGEAPTEDSQLYQSSYLPKLATIANEKSRKGYAKYANNSIDLIQETSVKYVSGSKLNASRFKNAAKNEDHSKQDDGTKGATPNNYDFTQTHSTTFLEQNRE